MAVIRWQLAVPISDRQVLLPAPYRSGTVAVRNTRKGKDALPFVSPVITVTPPAHDPAIVLLVVDLYAGGAFLIITDEHPARLPTSGRSVSVPGDDDLPSTLMVSERDAPDVPTRELRVVRPGQCFLFQAADR